MTKDTMIGVDLAKAVFQLHATSMTGEPRFCKKLVAAEFPQIYGRAASCGGRDGGLWQRALLGPRGMTGLGHEVKLIAPQYVRPFVKRQKNDAADAEAIVIAAQRPEMRFVEPKSAEQQGRAMLFRARTRLVQQRTELVNMLRAFLYELGHVVSQGINNVPRITQPSPTAICLRLPGLNASICWSRSRQ